MKLFGDYQAVMFEQENLIFVTHNEYLYYIYDVKYDSWRMHRNRGNDRITLCNYRDVTEKELTDAMHGKLPQKATDFTRLCSPAQLSVGNLLVLLQEDYECYMSDYSIYRGVNLFLTESVIQYRAYADVKNLLDQALGTGMEKEQVLKELKSISLLRIGRDIFQEQIRIVDGHDCTSYFWIMPARIIDDSDTDNWNNVAKLQQLEISIEEDDVAQYLSCFLHKHFDGKLEANKRRREAKGFEWYLTHNYFTFDSMRAILADIKDTMNAFSDGRETEVTAKILKNGWVFPVSREMPPEPTEEQKEVYHANLPNEEKAAIARIVDFYRRFTYRMEYMMRVGEEKGFNLISFMGP